MCYAGCHAGHSMRLLSDDSDDSETKPNVTLATDNVCLKAVVQEGNYNYYNLDFSSCYDDTGFSYVSLEARITKMCNSSQQWSLLVNTKGDLPEIEDTNDPDEETYMDLTGEACQTLPVHAYQVSAGFYTLAQQMHRKPMTQPFISITEDHVCYFDTRV